MPQPDLTEMEAAVLQAVHAEGQADLYDLTQALGTGPRTVQDAVRSLARAGLLYVSERGRKMTCTRRGDQVARAQRPDEQQKGAPPGRP